MLLSFQIADILPDGVSMLRSTVRISFMELRGVQGLHRCFEVFAQLTNPVSPHSLLRPSIRPPSQAGAAEKLKQEEMIFLPLPVPVFIRQNPAALTLSRVDRAVFRVNETGTCAII